jgi:hypothetical protein
MPTDCAADPRHLKEHGEHKHHNGTDRRGNKLGRIDQQPAGKHRLQDEDGIRRQPQADPIDVAAPDCLPKALEKVGDPERRHEQDDPFLIDETAQDQELDGIGKRDHDQD